jgi:hypothetical protein
MALKGPKRVNSYTSVGAAMDDVGEAAVPSATDRRIEEAQSWLLVPHMQSIEVCDNCSEGGCRTTCAVDWASFTLVGDGEIDAFCLNVLDSSSIWVVCFWPICPQVRLGRLNGVVLIRRPREEIREAAIRERGRNFGFDILHSTNSRDELT